MSDCRQKICTKNKLLFSSVALGGMLLFSPLWAQEDHSQHQDHNAMEHEASSKGGDMAGMDHGDHVMTQEMYDELRAKIPLYATYSNQEIDLSMQMMGGNYPLYVSDEALQGEIGVLILAHGFGKRGDKTLVKNLEGFAGLFPTALGFGMSMMGSSHIQSALDDLAKAGAKKIIVLPAVSQTNNSMKRQWDYIFGLHDEAPYLSVPRVKTEAEIIFATALDDHPLVGEALTDFADDLSTDPDNEVVLVVSHGPVSEEDNKRELEILANLAEIVEQDGGYSAAHGLTLQDDAPKAIRDANVERLRGLVEEATTSGKKVLIVSNLMATRGIQHKIRKDLAGLDYSFNSKGLTQHENFIRWIQETVREKAQPE